MRLLLCLAVLPTLLAPWLATPASAQANIVTGDPSGTYIRVGRDIAALGAECGLSLNVRESAGSFENFRAVRDRKATQFGIVQDDVLEYFQTFQGEDAEARRLMRGIRIVLPLFEEEIHVIARRDIADLAGLAGKRVAVGAGDSGTALTAALILDLAEVTPAERLELGPADSLAALRAGEIDAFFYVVGAPAALLEDPGIDPAQFHLLPLTAPVLRALYTPAVISGGTYGFQPGPVEVVAVRAVLITFDFQPQRNSYQAAACRSVADFSHLVVNRLDRLRATGHPKWKAVDLTALPAGWPVSDCMLEGLAPEHSLACTMADDPPAAQSAARPTAIEPEQVYLERICARIGC